MSLASPREQPRGEAVNSVKDTPLTEQELISQIEIQVSAAIGHWGAGWGISGTGIGTPVVRQSLAEQRALALDYYDRMPFGNEVEGESQVVSSDVFDTIEGMLPGLIRIFTGTDDVVQFEPNGPEDEDQAQQMTEVANYVMYRQNNGFLILYQWFKDALLQNNGIVKYWWDKRESKSKSEYADLSMEQLQKLLNPSDGSQVNLISHAEKPDTAALEQHDAEFKQAMAQAEQQFQQSQQTPQPMPPEAFAMLQLQMKEQYLATMPQPLHDIEVEVVRDVSKVCIEVVPPEEFGISAEHKSVSVQGGHERSPFTFHRRNMSISRLREMGCPEEVIERAGSATTDGNEISTSVEVLARDRFIDQVVQVPPTLQPSQKEIIVTECWYEVDMDGDGITELRHIIKVGQAIWINEETDHINIACLTPIIMPHTWVGMSAAELVMSDQFTKSVLWRQMLNNLYLTNNPRKAVLARPDGTMLANADDLMDNRAGGIMREYQPGAIRNEEVPFVAEKAFGMMEYIDSQKEVRTGQTRYSQGTDADTLNKTARGIQMIQAAGQQRLELIARSFAETGIKDLMRGIVYMLSKYPSKAMTVRLRGKWVEVDPREWTSMFDMTINVGLGTGNRDAMLAHLDRITQSQAELIQSGRGYMVTDENVFNVFKKRAEAMGFKNPEMFVADPETVEKPPKQPNPDILKIQSEDKQAQDKIRSNEQLAGHSAHTEKEIAAMQMASAERIAVINAESREREAMHRMEHEARLKIYEQNNAQDGSADREAMMARMQMELQAAIEKDQLASAERIKQAELAFEEWKTRYEQLGAERLAAIDADTKKMVAKMKPKPAAKKPNGSGASA